MMIYFNCDVLYAEPSVQGVHYVQLHMCSSHVPSGWRFSSVWIPPWKSHSDPLYVHTGVHHIQTAILQLEFHSGEED